jgi:hypothetical protein
MSISDEPGPEDGLFAQLAGMEAHVNDEVNVRLLSDYALADKLADVRRVLIDSGEMLEPRTEAGRDLHSLRAALLIEHRQRQNKGMSDSEGEGT